MKQLIERLAKFNADRDWGKYHTHQELVRKIIIEAGELNQLFEWGQIPDEERYKEELGDVLICCINACITAGFNPTIICHEKIDKNEIKYPANKC